MAAVMNNHVRRLPFLPIPKVVTILVHSNKLILTVPVSAPWFLCEPRSVKGRVSMPVERHLHDRLYDRHPLSNHARTPLLASRLKQGQRFWRLSVEPSVGSGGRA